MTQREVGEAAGLATAYLSRVENCRLVPGIPTLNRIARALDVPVYSFFDSTILEAKEQCPVSLSGKCILDQKHLGRGRKPIRGVESYTSEQLEVLRLCNLLVHSRDKNLFRALKTLLGGLLAVQKGGVKISNESPEGLACSKEEVIPE